VYIRACALRRLPALLIDACLHACPLVPQRTLNARVACLPGGCSLPFRSGKTQVVWVLNLSGEDKKKLQNNQKNLLLDQEAPLKSKRHAGKEMNQKPNTSIIHAKTGSVLP
jgi:hypothetical protein